MADHIRCQGNSKLCVNKRNVNNPELLILPTTTKRHKTQRLSHTHTKMEALRDSTNVMAHAPLLEFAAKSPPKLVLSSPIRRSPPKDDPMSKPPGRVSPFKGARSSMSAEQIFATTPRRRAANARAQSVDREPPENHLPSAATATTAASEAKSLITFEKLKPMASSNMRLITPSRMVTSKQKRAIGTQSEQPIPRLSRANALTKDPASNLMESFTQKSILKRRLSPPVEADESSLGENEMDMTTTLNTMKNAESAKNVMKFLKVEAKQPRKRRAVTFDNDTDGSHSVLRPVKGEDDEEEDLKIMLKQVLLNQNAILQRLSTIESHMNSLNR